MSNLTQIAMIMAIGIPHIVVYVFLGRVAKGQENEILTGLIGATPISIRYRWLSLYTSWAQPAIVQLGFQLLMLIVYLVITKNVTDDGVKLVAYAGVLFTSLGIVGSLMVFGFGYSHLRSVLRQAEAD